MIATPDLVTTVVSTTPSSTVDKDASPLVDSKDLINGSDRGDVISAASGLILSIPAPEDFTVTASSLSSNTSRVNSGGPVDSSSLSRYTITFELAALETGTLSLGFTHTLLDLGVTSSISWSLAGPGGIVAAASGTLTAISGQATAQTGTTSQSVALATGGTYNFTIETSQPTLTLQNSKSGSAEVTNFSLAYDSDLLVPEPTSALLSLLALPLLLGRRR